MTRLDDLRLTARTLAAAAIALVPAAPLFATPPVDTGSAEHIESAEFLRIYSQEVVAAACFLHSGVNPGLATSLLQEARDGFTLHLDALRNGNVDLGIVGGEERRKTLVQLEALGAEWAEVAMAVDALFADTSDEAAYAIIDAHDDTLYEMTHRIVSEIENEYANPAEILLAEVVTLEIIGRQAAMSQKIAKGAYRAWNVGMTAEIEGQLSRAISQYEASLDALLNGYPALGIAKPPTPEINAMLLEIQADWTEMKPILDTLMSGVTPSKEVEAYFFDHMTDEMYKLEEVMHAYAKWTKHTY